MIKTRILTILYTLCLLTLSGYIYAGDTDSEETKSKTETESTVENNPEDTEKKEEGSEEEDDGDEEPDCD